MNRPRDKRKVVVFVEGGGDTEATRTASRLGFQTLFRGLRERAHPLPFEVVCRGGRSVTFEAFRDSAMTTPTALRILLVDAEQEYDSAGVWRHLKEVRTEDGWERPGWADEAHAYLMVPTVEAWIVKDGEALARRYRQFETGKLPRRRDLETVPKPDLYRALAAATAKAGGYEKRDAFALVGVLAPERLTVADARYDALAAAGRLFAGLPELIEEYKRSE